MPKGPVRIFAQQSRTEEIPGMSDEIKKRKEER